MYTLYKADKLKMSHKNSFMFYPEVTDEDFYEKIYLKKEFRDTEIKTKYKNAGIQKEISKEFILAPHQVFLKNYISPDTPYNGVLVYHSVGVGKTCTAISIAEGFKKTLKNMNKKILILSNLRYNFIDELYDSRKERRKTNPEQVVQCTGKAYELGVNSVYLTRGQREKEILKLKKMYYQFFGYGQFANYVINNTGDWDGTEAKINEKVKNFISKEFDDRVIIMDEIQNIKTDKREGYIRKIQPILESIIKYGKNIKLVLMSATPMFDRPDEIIFYINLLLQNDRRPKIDKNTIFNSKDGTLKPGAEEILRNIFKGYISYVRGEKPETFPFRIYPDNSVIPDVKNVKYYMSGQKIDNEKKIKFTKLILCDMIGVQNNTYQYYFNKKIEEGKIKDELDQADFTADIENLIDVDEEISHKKKEMGILFDLTKISNITYPELENPNQSSNSNYNSNNSNNSNNSIQLSSIGSFGKKSIDADYDNGIGGYYRNIQNISGKRKIKYKYQEHSIFDKDTIHEAPFADEKHLKNYSIKFAKILDTIKKSKGLIFVSSQFIEQGTLAFALMLEQNGFDRECSEGEENLLDYSPNKLKKGGRHKQICYLCGKEANYIEHTDEKIKSYHLFKRAKYILFFGEQKDIIKITKDEALKKFSNENNKYGEVVKVFIGTRTVSEGLDFKFIRQVHIMEPWYNLSRHEQIIGRAIRYKSHIDLPYEERNVEIYQYAAVMKKSKISERETVDLKNYRIAENKDIIIKNISHIMKESAIDCALFRNSNIINSNKKIRQITSTGKILNISIGDSPYTPLCDYKKNCDFKCAWTPNPKITYPLNTDTYNIRFASNDIEMAKKHIKYLFRQNNVYHLNIIENYVLQQMPNIDKLFIYSAIEEIVNNKNEIIYDKFSRKGYIIYRGDYYIYQPFDLERDNLPIIYRIYPEAKKENNVNLENINIDYNTLKNKSNKLNMKNNPIDNKFNKNIIQNIDDTLFLYKNIDDKKINHDIYKKSVIGFIIDKLNLKDEIIFIKNILKQYLSKNIDSKKNIYFDYILSYLNESNKLINYYADINFEKDKIKNNLFVGFIINNEYYILENLLNFDIKNFEKKGIQENFLNFISCPIDIIKKIKSYRELKDKKNNKKDKKKSDIDENKYNLIYGILEISKKYIKKFKLVNKYIENNIEFEKEKKKSKRSQITGRVCSSFHKPELVDILTILKIDLESEKKKIGYLCEYLEIYFRYNQYLMKNNKNWFIIKGEES
jgi:hypothetical protein